MAFACGRCVECDGGRGYEFCVSPRGIIGDFRPLGPIDGEAREQERMRAERDDLRAQRDALAEALREVGAWSEDEQARCWCSIPSMIPYRGHDGGCEAARAALAKVAP